MEKDMTVEGITIPAKDVAALRGWILSNVHSFKARDVTRAAAYIRPDAYEACYRWADRELQRLRRAGLIKFASGEWRVIRRHD